MSTPDLEERQAGTSKRYIMRQKMVSIGDDYWIENEQGEQVYQVDGKVLSLKKILYLKDPQGKKLAKIKKAFVTVKEKMEIEGPDGERLAIVSKDLFTPLKEHFVVRVKDGADLEVHGSIFDHEYTIDEGDHIVARVSKKLLHIRDSYTIQVEPGQDDLLILALVVCIDAMTHN